MFASSAMESFAMEANVRLCVPFSQRLTSVYRNDYAI